MINDLTLVNDIYYKLQEGWSLTSVPENNEILGRIKNNIKDYGNIPIEEVDKEHSWIKIESPQVYDIKFIKTKGYETHLKICKEIDDYNKNMWDLYYKNHLNNPKNYLSFPQTKEHPIPWNNFLVLKAYRCLKTKSIGFTYYVKNTFMIKPFHVITHKWEFKNVGNRGDFEYNCKNCGTEGIKYKGMPSGEIFPKSDFMLSCNEHIIKRFLE